MSEYINLSHSKTRLFYHIVFSTKYRKKCLEPIKEYILKYIKESETKEFTVCFSNTDKDHIHLLIHTTPNISIAEIVHRLKQQTTYFMWHNHYNYMRKWYWGRQHRLWTRGYFCSTIGSVSKQTLESYIEKQSL